MPNVLAVSVLSRYSDWVTNGCPYNLSTSKNGLCQMIKSYEAHVKDYPELQIIIDHMRKDAEGIVE